MSVRGRFLGVAVAAAAILFAVSAPAAKAATTIFTLSANNLGVTGPIGTVTVTDVGGGVQISIAMDSGFSLKLQGGDIGFNLDTSITSADIAFNSISFGGTTISPPNISFKLTSKTNLGGAGSFNEDISNLKCSSCAKGVVSADDLVLTISGLTTKDFGSNGQGNSSVLHFCTASGSSCGPQTGFTSGVTSVVPEPASMALFGTGLVVFGGILRRRKKNQNPVA